MTDAEIELFKKSEMYEKMQDWRKRKAKKLSNIEEIDFKKEDVLLELSRKKGYLEGISDFLNSINHYAEKQEETDG